MGRGFCLCAWRTIAQTTREPLRTNHVVLRQFASAQWQHFCVKHAVRKRSGNIGVPRSSAQNASPSPPFLRRPPPRPPQRRRQSTLAGPATGQDPRRNAARRPATGAAGLVPPSETATAEPGDGPEAARPRGAVDTMDRYGKAQRVVYETLAKPPEGYRAGEIYGVSILVLIAANVVVNVLETVPALLARRERFFYYFELASVVVFTAEYVLTLWSCVAHPRFGSRGPLRGRVWAATRPMAVVDLLAILPFYLGSFVAVDLRFVRVLRLFRLFRLFRAGKMAQAFRVLSAVVLDKREQLMLGLLILVVVVLLLSSVMYIIEQNQPNTKFTSAAAAMWWAVVTVTTIGYGNMVPTSAMGKVFGSFAGFLGICVFAIPVGIIGAGFIEQSALATGPNGRDRGNPGDRSSKNGVAAADSGRSRTASRATPENGTHDHDDGAPAARRSPSSELETSDASLLISAAEKTRDSALALDPTSPCPSTSDEVAPPPPGAANPHGEAEADTTTNCYRKAQRFVYETVVKPPEGYLVGEIYSYLILLFISVNIIVGVLETVPSLFAKYATFFYYFEFVSVVIFTVEYILMLWSSVADPQFGSRGPVCGRVQAATRPLAVVDILAILPFYLSSIVKVDLRFVWVLRLFRLFRLFRSQKMAMSAKVMWEVTFDNREQLTMGLLIFVVVVLLVSSVMYIIEQGQINTKFTSIPASMWWGIITITTIGYGDMVPDSPVGKAFASLVGFLGICVYAIPVGIVGTGFINYTASTAAEDSGGGGGGAAPHVPPEGVADGDCADDRPPAAQRQLSPDLEMSAVSALAIAAEAPLDSALETPVVDQCPNKGDKACPSLQVEGQCPTNGIQLCPPPSTAVDPEEEGEAPAKVNFYSKVQLMVYKTVTEQPEDFLIGKIYGSAILIVISANIITGILETIPSLAKYAKFFYYFELASVVIFSVDYVLMLWSSVANPLFRSRGPFCGRVRAATRPLAAVDILAILPFYLSSFIQVDLRFLRVLRLARILRLFHSRRLAKSSKLLAKSILANREQLTLGLMLLFLVILLVSWVIFIIEQGQPNTKFTSIPASMWWGVITVTTIGYGDIVPTSATGKVFASFVSLLAICLYAIPVGIIGSGFIHFSNSAAESNTMHVPSESGVDGSNRLAASSTCSPAAQERPSSDLEMSGASPLTSAAEEPLDSVTETQANPFAPRAMKSQYPTNKDEVCPPTSSSTNPRDEGEPADSMKCYGKVQQMVYETVIEPPENYLAGKLFGSSILVFIVLNIACSALETVPTLFAKYAKFFYYFELASVVIFTTEYVLMLWSCVVDPKLGSRGPVCGRVRAATRPLAVVDVLAILPFYLSSFIQVDLRFVRVLRLFRLFRLFRFGKMAESAKVIAAVILSSREELTISLLMLMLVVLLMSSVMFIIEQGQINTKFTSIPASMWWGIVTIATIGYGDMVPTSAAGKAFASFVGFLGICVFAVSIGIIGAGFNKHTGANSSEVKGQAAWSFLA